MAVTLLVSVGAIILDCIVDNILFWLMITATIMP